MLTDSIVLILTRSYYIVSLKTFEKHKLGIYINTTLHSNIMQYKRKSPNYHNYFLCIWKLKTKLIFSTFSTHD